MRPHEHYSELDNDIKNKIKYMIPDSIRNLIQPRQFQCFCIGTPKSGTTSVAGLFDKHFRSSHEPERRSIIFFMNDHYHGKYSDDEYVEWLKKRDRRVWLDMESNCFLGYRMDLLYRAFPDAKYILSVREPLSWLDSMLNHTINYSPASEDVIALWHRIYFKPEQYPHQTIEQPLKDAGVYSVEAYLRYWSDSIKSVLNTIPESQLLIVKTHEFKDRTLDIAQFLGVDPIKIDLTSGHLNKAPQKYDFLKLLPPDFITEQLSKFSAETCEKVNIDFSRITRKVSEMAR